MRSKPSQVLLRTAMDGGRRSPTPVPSCVNVAGNSDEAARFRCWSRSRRVVLSLIEASSSFRPKSCSSVDVLLPAVAPACLDKAGMRTEPSCAQRDAPAQHPAGLEERL